VLGDVVRIIETRPISKEKRWRIAETLVRGNVADIAPREIGVPELPEDAPPAVEPPTMAATAPTATPVEEQPSATEAVEATEPAAEATTEAAPSEGTEETRA
jgi:hypothetical protein